MQFACACDRFGTVIYFELAQEAMDVPFDGADLDEEPDCYLPVGEALGDQREHLPLARGEGIEERLSLSPGQPAGPVASVLVCGDSNAASNRRT